MLLLQPIRALNLLIKKKKILFTGYELCRKLKFLDICFDKLINRYSSHSEEFFYNRPPTFEFIVKANSILTYFIQN